MFLHLLLALLAKVVSRTQRIRDKVSSYLYWNGSIRFMMEGYMDFCLFTLINLKELKWNDPFFAIHASNIFAIVLIVLLIGLPIFLIYFFVRNS